MRKTSIKRHYPPLSTEGRLVHTVPIDTITLQNSTLHYSLFTVILHKNVRFANFASCNTLLTVDTELGKDLDYSVSQRSLHFLITQKSARTTDLTS